MLEVSLLLACISYNLFIKKYVMLDILRGDLDILFS